MKSLERTQYPDCTDATLVEPMFVGGMLTLTQKNRMQRHLMKKCLEIIRDGVPPLVQWSHNNAFHIVKRMLPKLSFVGDRVQEGRAQCVLFMEKEALKPIDTNIQLNNQLFHEKSPTIHNVADEKIILDKCPQAPDITLKKFMPPSPNLSSFLGRKQDGVHKASNSSLLTNNKKLIASNYGAGTFSSLRDSTSTNSETNKIKMTSKEHINLNWSSAASYQPQRLPLTHGFKPANTLPNINNKWQIKVAIDLHLKRKVERLHASLVSEHLPKPGQSNKLTISPHDPGVPPVGKLQMYNMVLATHAITPKGMLKLTTLLDIHLKKKMLEDYFGIPLLVKKSRILAKPPVAPSLGPELAEHRAMDVSHTRTGMDTPMSRHIPAPQCCSATMKPLVVPQIEETQINRVHTKKKLEFSFKIIVLRLLLGFKFLGRQETPYDLRVHINACHCSCHDYPYSTAIQLKHISPQPIRFPKLEILEMSAERSPHQQAAHMHYCHGIGDTKHSHETCTIKKYSVFGSYFPFLAVEAKKYKEKQTLRNVTRETELPLLNSETKGSTGRMIAKKLKKHLKQKTIMQSCCIPWRVIESQAIHKINKIQEGRDLTKKIREILRNKLQQEDNEARDQHGSAISHFANIRKLHETIEYGEPLQIHTDTGGFFWKEVGLAFPNGMRTFFAQYHSLEVEHNSVQRSYLKHTYGKETFTYESQQIGTVERQYLQSSISTTHESSSYSNDLRCPTHSSCTGKTPLFYVYPPIIHDEPCKKSVCYKGPKITSEGKICRPPLKIKLYGELSSQKLDVRKKQVCARHNPANSPWQIVSSLESEFETQNYTHQSQAKKQYIDGYIKPEKTTRESLKHQKPPNVSKNECINTQVNYSRSYLQAQTRNCYYLAGSSSKSNEKDMLLQAPHSSFTPATCTEGSPRRNFIKKDFKRDAGSVGSGSHKAWRAKTWFLQPKSLRMLIPLSYKKLQKWYENLKSRHRTWMKKIRK
ncbi:hypothetical protein NDU88_004660 [Pleurodeles waltl]|uniref:Uncharacterized protein n=1 Tax=Pleurodeles waltl TaxID=8319 RepID=A0AAV7NP48_PLEWA|nr:hypothetical protein NDU88_004660 [Pleurodeles waltl]